MTSSGSPVSVSAEVRCALDAGRPVVALESTILTHGLPRPRNRAVAANAEEHLRQSAVVPATVAVLDGVPTVGLSGAELDQLCTVDAPAKLSVRDLPVAVATRSSGGTTVAATSVLTHRVGIAVFATGGLGGVHHGAATSFDESADLLTLATTPIVVVSAGIKSVLDIAATLERLETLNIPIVGYRTRRLPGFYVTDSGYDLAHSVTEPRDVAAIAGARDALDLRSALLVTNPIPADRQLDPALHDRLLTDAWEAARREHVTGQATTPFLLEHIQRESGGQSLRTNVEAYRNNVALAADIAIALAA